MKNNGFTLIELLAVTIILAIILLLTVSTVSNSIKKARRDVFESSAKMILRAAESDYMDYGTAMTVVYENGVAVGDDIYYGGTRPENGIIKILSDGSIEMAIHNGYSCAIKERNKDIIVSDLPLGECIIPVPVFAGHTPSKFAVGHNYSLFADNSGDLYLNYTKNQPEVRDYFAQEIVGYEAPTQVDHFLGKVDGLFISHILSNYDEPYPNYVFETDQDLQNFYNSNAFKNFLFMEYLHGGVYDFSGEGYNSYFLSGGNPSLYDFLDNYPMTEYDSAYTSNFHFTNYVTSSISEVDAYMKRDNSLTTIAEYLITTYETYSEAYNQMGMPGAIGPINEMIDAIQHVIYFANYYPYSYWSPNSALIMMEPSSYTDEYNNYVTNNSVAWGNYIDQVKAEVASISGLSSFEPELTTPTDHALYFYRNFFEIAGSENNGDQLAYYIYTNPEWYKEDPSLLLSNINSTPVTTSPSFEIFLNEFIDVYIELPDLLIENETETIQLNQSGVEEVIIQDEVISILKNDGKVYSFGGIMCEFDCGEGSPLPELVFEEITGLSDIVRIGEYGIPTFFEGNVFVVPLMYAIDSNNQVKLYHSTFGVIEVSGDCDEVCSLIDLTAKQLLYTDSMIYVVREDGIMNISGSLGYTSSGTALEDLMFLETEIDRPKPIKQVYELADVSSVKEYRVLLVYEDGSSEIMSKNLSIQTGDPVESAFVFSPSNIANFKEIYTENNLTIIKDDSNNLTAFGQNITNIFGLPSESDILGTITALSENIDIKKTQFNSCEFGCSDSSVILLDHEGNITYRGYDILPEFNSGDSSNSFVTVSSLNIEDFDYITYDSPMIVGSYLSILDKDNNIRSFGYMVVDPN